MALVAVVLGMAASIYSQSGINSILEVIILFLVGFCVLGAGWVAVWMPFETFLYDGWPFQQNMRIYHHIAHAEVVIKERNGGEAAQVKDTETVRGTSLS